jgi:hypothetical protein
MGTSPIETCVVPLKLKINAVLYLKPDYYGSHSWWVRFILGFSLAVSLLEIFSFDFYFSFTIVVILYLERLFLKEYGRRKPLK